MNCPNCGWITEQAYEERNTLALESIAESLRNLPSKRELLAAMVMHRIGGVPSSAGYCLMFVDAIIAACKETKNE